MKNKDFYLRRNFSKQYSYYGTPFLAEYCDIKSSDNLIIYGHNMKSGTMFADLIKYKNYNYYKNHKYIELYTLDNSETIKNEYKIIYCFKTTADSKGFNFYDYYKFENEDELNVFKDNCKRLSFFNTNEEISLSDKFITLSTCEYSNKNGRMIVVAKKIQRGGNEVKDIKVKKKTNIKVLDKTITGTKNIKDNLVSIKEKSKDDSSNVISANDYATNKITSAERMVENKLTNNFNKAGINSVKRTKENIVLTKNKIAEIKNNKKIRIRFNG